MSDIKLVILDRDGVINVDSPDYIKSPEEWLPIPGSIEAISQLCKAHYTVAIATNQSGLARGLYDLDTMHAMHHKMQTLIKEQGGSIDHVFYCPHAPWDNCECRKPKTRLLEQIAAHYHCDLTDVPFIGDSLRDVQAARAMQCHPILVKTGKGEKTLQEATDELDNVPVFENLLKAVEALLAKFPLQMG